MKLFKKLMSAMLAGVLAVGMLAGCSGGSGSVNGPVPTSPARKTRPCRLYMK